MTVAGVSIKTLVLLVVLVAGGAWGWAAAVEPVGVDLGGGYANTTVTIPGGFWLASFGALFLGIMIAVQPTGRRCSGSSTPSARASASVPSRRRSMPRPTGSWERRSSRPCASSSRPSLLYVTRIVKPTQKMAFAVIAGMGGLVLLYLFVFVLSIFNWDWLYSDEFRTVGIAVTLIAIVLAALSLVLDFGTIEAGVQAGAPKELEWYLGFGLMVTLIWLYISILKLLALLSRNR